MSATASVGLAAQWYSQTVVSMAAVTVKPARRVRGRVRVPGDKSISHRYALLAALADGRSTIRGFAPGADCEATLSCLARLGVAIDRRSNGSAPLVEVTGAGARHFAAPSVPLDAANSGTTIRLLTGVLAGQPGLTVQLVGDASLSRRPMRRIVDPLSRMGASIESTDGRPPLRVEGRMLSAIDFAADVPSAQVKSAILLAGLFAEGMTSVHEPIPTRDHTERAFKEFGVESSTVDNRTMRPGRADVDRARPRGARRYLVGRLLGRRGSGVARFGRHAR